MLKTTVSSFSNCNYNEFKHTFNVVIIHWFQANQLILNTDKTNIVQSTTNSGTSHSLSFEHANKLFTEVPKRKLLGLYIDNQLNWKSHIEKITPKLGAICHAIKNFLIL
jgi:hypothetical protein